jgi:hypothetical protein
MPEQATTALPVASVPAPTAPGAHEQQAQQSPEDMKTMQAVPRAVDTLPTAETQEAAPMAGSQPAAAPEMAQKIGSAVEGQPRTDTQQAVPSSVQSISNPQQTPLQQVPETAKNVEMAADAEKAGMHASVHTAAVGTSTSTAMMDDDQDDELKAFKAAVSSIPFADEAGDS